MRIGVDMDGVVANFNASFIPRMIANAGKDLFGPEFIPTVWDYPLLVGYTVEEMTAALAEIEQDPTFWRSLECYHGEQVIKALDTLSTAQARGEHEVYFITNRMGKLVKWQTERWLKSHGMSDPTVLLTKNKGLAAAALDLDAYIDDKLENIVDVLHHTGITCMPFLCDRPWNQTPRDIIQEHEIPVVKSLYEMLQSLHKVE